MPGREVRCVRKMFKKKKKLLICVITATGSQHKSGGVVKIIFSLFFFPSEIPKTSPRFLKQNYIFSPEAGQTQPIGMSYLPFSQDCN